MSRGQENQVFDTAKQQNTDAASKAQESYDKAQTSIGQQQQDVDAYRTAGEKFAAENPYIAGGEYQTAQNQQLANTADASAQSAGQALQSQAVRTGQNAGGAIAATEAMQQTNERNLAAQEAEANEKRLSNLANYNQQVVNQAGELPSLQAGVTGAETNLVGQQLGSQQASLNTAQKAGETPSFMEQLWGNAQQAGQDFAKAGAAAAFA